MTRRICRRLPPRGSFWRVVGRARALNEWTPGPRMRGRCLMLRYTCGSGPLYVLWAKVLV